MKEYGLFINNRWHETSKTFESMNPATEEIVARFAVAEADDVDRAVMAARRAFDSGVWSGMLAMERGRIMRRAADIMREKLEELAIAETLDVGKPIIESRNFDVPMAIDHLEYYGSLVVDIVGSSIPAGNSVVDYTIREPIGVVAAIIPWNFPLVVALRKLAPALAAGNTTVIKPASWAPLTTVMLGDIFKEAGFPEGVVNIITGSGPAVGNTLASHPAVDKVSFTGSTEVGRSILSASTGNISGCCLELGAKSPAIVLPDAHIDEAVEGILFGAFLNQGECCCALTRVVADSKIHKPLVDRLVKRASEVTIGNGIDESTQLGPLVSEGHRQAVMDYIKSGIAEAGVPAVGGGVPKGFDKGYFLEPTIFDNVPVTSRIYREEIFGPVITVTAFDGTEELLSAANDTPYGLAASIWTSDAAAGQRLAARIKAGTVWVNIHNYVFSQAPFGGYKQSGLGRELGREGLDAYTEVKNVVTWVGAESFKWY